MKWTEVGTGLRRQKAADPGAELYPDIKAALSRLSGVARSTPCTPFDTPDGKAWFKLENTQRTGSFKIRGAYNRIAADEDAPAKGVVTASSGNHGRAVASIAQQLGIRAKVCVPDWVDPVKRTAIMDSGAEVVLSGPTYEDAEDAAIALARDTGMVFIHPFDDLLVIAGQATLGVELAGQIPRDVTTVFVPVSGGGLATGVALGLRYAGHPTEVVGVCAEASPSMHASIRAGAPVEVTEHATLASALSGGIGLQNRWTFELARAHLDELVMVTDDEIADGIRFAARELHQIVEGGAATAIAAWLRTRPADTACVVSGGNIDLPILAGVLAEGGR